MANEGQRALTPGTIVHRRYQIERVLGEGGFGVTYLVTDLRENQIAAMKEYMPADIALRKAGTDLVIPKQGYEDSYARFRDRFLEEAQVIYQYRGHPNIIDVNHLFYDNNAAYYVMEYIPGQDLKRQLKQSGERLSWDELGPIISQVVSALKEVHSRDMIHCDISPDNIFVRNDGQVKLIDFGAAKGVMNTQSSIILLKRGFAPPEQLSANGRLGPWTDIYALAVTIYRAFTGRMPPESAERMNDDRTIWPSELGLMAPSPQWEMALKKAMALRIQDRYQDVETFWTELSQFDSLQPYLEAEILGLRGYYDETRVPVEDEVLYLGRNPETCHFLYPNGTPGVSFEHLCIWAEGGAVYIKDLQSSYGTWMKGMRLEPYRAYQIRHGEIFYIGSKEQAFCLIQQQEHYY